jgi:hypothetical protein
MSSITIHALDPAIDSRLTEEARRSKKSKNQLVKDILARALGLPSEEKFADDYREFCGIWTAAQRAEFDASQAGNQRVDDGDWQ